MIEYAVKYGRYIGAETFKTRTRAEREIKACEEADRAYDIPNPPRRCVVWREVGPWRKVGKEDGEK